MLTYIKDITGYAKGKLHHDPHGSTVNTDHLRPGQLIHTDLYFINTVSIKGFTSVLLIMDANTHKLWQFPTPQKRPQPDTVTFIMCQLKIIDREVQHIRSDIGGELADLQSFVLSSKTNSKWDQRGQMHHLLG